MAGERDDAPTPRHLPVMWTQVMEGLQVRTDGRYLDGTFGRGGTKIEVSRARTTSSSGTFHTCSRKGDATRSAAIADSPTPAATRPLSGPRRKR
jgi:16S rRNA C1402 N4-methylase RsmH